MPVRVIEQSGKPVMVPRWGENSASGDAVTVANVAALRTTAPSEDGQAVYLNEYSEGTGYGGGWVVGHLGTKTDDGGYIFAGTGFYWQRAEDINDLNVTHWGAIPDGEADAASACTAMLEFMMSDEAVAVAGISTVRQAGIKFPVGTFYITPVDWRKYGTAIASGSSDLSYYPSGYYAYGGIRIQGFVSPYGKQVFTKIISDKSTNTVFQLNHRRMVIEGISWDGQQSTGYSTDTYLLTGSTLGDFAAGASNTQGFISNECVAGCYMYVKNFSTSNTGGYGIYVLDTLDSIIEQCYAEKNAAPVFQVGWSNYPTGVWDHSTSLEIRNCNFLTNLAPAIWAPRMQQAIMRNVWFSGPGTTPMDINNGQWLMEMICIEGCVHDAVCYATKAQVDVLSVPTGNSMDFSTTPSSTDWASYTTNPDGSSITSWLSGYERGNIREEAYGMEIEGTFKTKWFSGVLRGANNTTSAIYLNLGSIQLPNVGGIMEFEVICRDGYSSVGSSNYNVTADRSPGKTIIRVQRGASTTPIVTYFHEGASGVTGVWYVNQTYSDTLPGIWIKLNSYVGEYVVNAKCTGPTRFDAGTWTLYTVDGTTQTTAPSNVVAATARMSIHNGSAGIGAQGSNLALTTATGTPASTTSPTGYMAVVINGTVGYVPYYT